MLNRNSEQRGAGIEKVPEIDKWNGQFSGGPVQPRKVVHLERKTLRFPFSQNFRDFRSEIFTVSGIIKLKLHSHLQDIFN